MISAGSLESDEFFKENGYTRSPVLVQWMATQRCSLSCPHCLCGGLVPQNELSLAEVESLLDQVAQMGVKELLLTGGEPLERGDLPEVIDMMRRCGMRWSLNTSAFPGRECRAAMEKHPPAFVAVSLDGPEEFHDAFRGRKGSFRQCLRALAYFKDVTSGSVAAGTTLHSHNFDFLTETFALVVESGATSWGVHLTFPEGKARGRPEFHLSKRQLRKLLVFVARARKSFPVILADEIGYTGDLEPEVRAAPFFCGAGRAQCVVLSDGEVVPCSTVDRSESAGNIRERSLEDIWHSGFAEIRNYRPSGKCAACEFAPMCGGGCWLQRRHGQQCFKDLWITPRSYAAAAGIALCLGLAACAGTDVPEARGEAWSLYAMTLPDQVKTKTEKENGKPAAAVEKSELLENSVIQWYFDQIGHHGISVVPKADDGAKKDKKKLAADPAGKYLVQISNGKYPAGLEKRLKRIKKALETSYRSLAFASLLWRDLTLWCLEGTPPEKRTAEEEKILKETASLLAEKAAEWRGDILKQQLDSFISSNPGQRHHWFMMSKAVMPGERFRSAKANFSMEHWGLDKYTDEITKEHVKTHPFGGHMSLKFETSNISGLKKLSQEGSKKVKAKDHLGIFDILVVPEEKGKSGAVIAFTSGEKKFNVALPAGTQLLFGDVLRLAYEQNAAEMDGMVKKMSSSSSVPEPQPLYLPALEKFLHGLGQDEKSKKTTVLTTLLSIWLF